MKVNFVASMVIAILCAGCGSSSSATDGVFANSFPEPAAFKSEWNKHSESPYQIQSDWDTPQQDGSRFAHVADGAILIVYDPKGPEYSFGNLLPAAQVGSGVAAAYLTLIHLFVKNASQADAASIISVSGHGSMPHVRRGDVEFSCYSQSTLPQGGISCGVQPASN
jgi:hypothetical protein